MIKKEFKIKILEDQLFDKHVHFIINFKIINSIIIMVLAFCLIRFHFVIIRIIFKINPIIINFLNILNIIIVINVTKEF